MRAAGKDGTKLFGTSRCMAYTRSLCADFKHSWVNAEAMLMKCFVGYFVGEP